jgi:NADPH:quinone reductase-like Zn-dependent oxidoreductase
MLSYGTLSNEPLSINPRLMISGDRRLQGFWLGHWMRKRNIPQSLALFREIASLLHSGVLTTTIGPAFPLERIADAARTAETPGRPGKVLLRIRPA